LTLRMASARVVEASVTDGGPSRDSCHPDDLFQSRYVFFLLTEIIVLTLVGKAPELT